MTRKNAETTKWRTDVIDNDEIAEVAARRYDFDMHGVVDLREDFKVYDENEEYIAVNDLFGDLVLDVTEGRRHNTKFEEEFGEIPRIGDGHLVVIKKPN